MTAMLSVAADQERSTACGPNGTPPSPAGADGATDSVTRIEAPEASTDSVVIEMCETGIGQCLADRERRVEVAARPGVVSTSFVFVGREDRDAGIGRQADHDPGDGGRPGG